MDTAYQKMKQFLEEVDSDFPVPLSAKQDLSRFTQKILKYATICSKEAEGKLCAAAIGYTENLTDNLAYLSVVATLSAYRGQGLAQKCVSDFLDICKEKHIAAVHLYTASGNIPAIQMYTSLGFQPYHPAKEPRPDDIHLIRRLS